MTENSYRSLESEIRDVMMGGKKRIHEAEVTSDPKDPFDTQEPSSKADEKTKSKKKTDPDNDDLDPSTIEIGKVSPVELNPTSDTNATSAGDKKDAKVVEGVVVEEKVRTIGKGIHFGNYHRSIRSRVMKIIATNQNLADKYKVRPKEGADVKEETVTEASKAYVGPPGRAATDAVRDTTADNHARAQQISDDNKKKSGSAFRSDPAYVDAFTKKKILPPKPPEKKNEEVEQLDELRRSTLASYIKKAHISGLKAAAEGEEAYQKGDRKKVNKTNLTGEKRETGINRAANKLAHEETNIDEARLAMPLRGHPYHEKSDDELRYISKDAHEAAIAMRGHSPQAENKYLDQVNDAATVMGYRKRGGKRVVKAPVTQEEIVNEGIKSSNPWHKATMAAARANKKRGGFSISGLQKKIKDHSKKLPEYEAMANDFQAKGDTYMEKEYRHLVQSTKDLVSDHEKMLADLKNKRSNEETITEAKPGFDPFAAGASLLVKTGLALWASRKAKQPGGSQKSAKDGQEHIKSPGLERAEQKPVEAPKPVEKILPDKPQQEAPAEKQAAPEKVKAIPQPKKVQATKPLSVSYKVGKDWKADPKQQFKNRKEADKFVEKLGKSGVSARINEILKNRPNIHKR